MVVSYASKSFVANRKKLTCLGGFEVVGDEYVPCVLGL